MNPDTGYLVSPEMYEHLKQKGRDFGYEPLPKELNGAAMRKLAGMEEATVSLTSGGRLSRWAAGRRKAKRKMQKESRRRNRR